MHANNKNIINTSPSLIFFGGLFIVSAVLFIRQPIEAVDTDLWFHLSGGRYFFSNYEISHNSFFSFLSPERTKINYSWFFQVLIYKIYSLAGYQGLIFLRAFIFLMIITVLYCLLDKTQNQKIFPFMFMAFVLLLLMRCLIIRPHVFSFLFLLLFIYILEINPKRIIFLPLIGILWINMHGIAYPVMILVTVSYAADFFYERIKKGTPFNQRQIFQLLFLVITMFTIFISPHGTGLLTVPFISTEYASQYIQELGGDGFNFAGFFNFSIKHLTPSLETLFNIIFLLVIIFVTIKFIKKKLPISHFLLFCGAIFLLIRSNNRFMYEFSLLSLPILNTKAFCYQKEKNIFQNKWVYCVFLLLLAVSTYGYSTKYFSNTPKYPISNANLPMGVTTFLKNIDSKGTVLNFPNSGGFLQWMLYPKYQVAMDMEVPHLFNDKDFFYVINAFFDDAGFKNFISKYEPSFITVPVSIYLNYNIGKRFRPNYGCVFFDDSEVLFVNKEKLPKVATEFGLVIDPALLVNLDAALLNRGITKDEKIVQNLFQMDALYPNCKMVNWAIANIFLEKKEFDFAEKYAHRITTTYPESYQGYKLIGDINLYSENYKEAISNYNIALRKKKDPEIYKNLSFCYVKTENFQKAYHTLKNGIDIYSTEVHYNDLFKLGLLSLQLNKKNESQMLMEFTDYKTPECETELKSRIQSIMNSLNY